MMVMQKTVIVECKCPLCGKNSVLRVDAEAYRRWKLGEFVQKAFPYLSDDEREALQTGTCPKCWEKMSDAPGSP